MLTATDRPEQAIGFLLASPEQTCNSNLQLARIHPKHAKPSSSPISITWKSVEGDAWILARVVATPR